MSIKLKKDVLQDILRYDPKRKQLFWRMRTIEYFCNAHNSAEKTQAIWNARYANKPVYVDPDTGKVCIFRFRVSAVEVIKALGHKGEHKNGSGHQLQMKFASQRALECVDVPGVYWNDQRNRYRAQIYIDGKVQHLGSHVTMDAAKAARKAAEQSYATP